MRRILPRTPCWIPRILVLLLCLSGGALRGDAIRFIRADSNADGVLNITDPIHTLGFLFLGAPQATPCADAADSNDDGRLDLSDAAFTLGFLFQGSSAPPQPYPDCGIDPTNDNLFCERHPPCSEGCRDEIAAIAQESSLVGSCSAVVRLDYLSRRILGWQLICGRYALVTEAEARERAQADTGYGASDSMLNAPGPEDVFVFYRPAGDFGGAGVVSARTGLTIFGGSIVWDGQGEITHPVEWRPPEVLGSDCPTLPRAIDSSAYDLRSGEPLDPVEADLSLDVVWRTALPEGLATSGYLFDAVVLLYPRSLGAFNPATAEWIVVLNAGWLE